jgi:hypothetical protein
MVHGIFLDSEACIRQDVLDPFSQNKVAAYQGDGILRCVLGGESAITLMDAKRH